MKTFQKWKVFLVSSLLSLTHKKLMYTTYILQSEKSGRFYVGHTEDITARLKKHNSGGVISTRNKGPWKVVYMEGSTTKANANRRELDIKQKKNRAYVEKLIMDWDGGKHVPASFSY
jgi:putative endonuclease